MTVSLVHSAALSTDVLISTDNWIGWGDAVAVEGRACATLPVTGPVVALPQSPCLRINECFYVVYLNLLL